MQAVRGCGVQKYLLSSLSRGTPGSAGNVSDSSLSRAAHLSLYCALVPFPACHPSVPPLQLCFPTLGLMLSVEWVPHSIWGLGTWLDSSKHAFRCVARQSQQHPWRDRGAPGPLPGRVSAPRNPLALGLLRPRRAAAASAALCCLLAGSWLGVTTVQMHLREAGVGWGGGGAAGGGESELGRGKGAFAVGRHQRLMDGFASLSAVNRKLV